jgi:hypothetical protein
MEVVNRTSKGDRLPLVKVIIPRTPAYEARLPDGCDPLVSALENSHLAHIAGRCVS